MAPISLDFASLPNGIQKGPEISIAEIGPHSPSLESLHSLHSPKLGGNRGLSSLTMTSRPGFGRSTSIAFEGRNTVHDFLTSLKNERFKHMPHDGSSWDRILKWADNIGGVVLLGLGVLSEFMLNCEDATRLICDSCTALIQLGSGHTKTLLKIFAHLHKIATSLPVFLRQSHIVKASADVRREMAHAFQDFAHLTRDIHIFYMARHKGVASIDSTELDAFMAAGSATFYRHLEHVSISSWAASKHCSHFNVAEIREFLTPQDSVVKKILSNPLYSDTRRAEYTCEWFSGPLRKFTRNGKKVMLVSGSACSGKSVLARFIHERLQESIENDPFDVIAYSVDTNVKYTTNPLNMIKTLLLQLLDRKIGSHSLLSHIKEGMKLAHSGCPSNEVENALWKAFELSLDERKLLVLIDGLDQLSGVRIGNPPCLEKLDAITKSKHNVKAILLSRAVSDAALKHCQEHISLDITPEAASDMKHFVEDFIHHSSQLHHLKDAETHEIVQKFATAAHGSFLLAGLQLRHVRDEESAAEFVKVLKSHKTVEEVLDRQISHLDTKSTETKHILSWILAAERPLTLKEIKALLEVDLNGCAYRPFSGDIEKTVRHLCRSLIVIRDGLVSFRHPSIRDRLVSSNSAKFTIDSKEAHRELAIRSMAYFKIHLQHNDIDPLSDLFNSREMTTAFSKHDLFEYASRHWISHFQSSSMYDKKNGQFSLPVEFKVAFSNATRLSLFEGSCIARQYIACEAEKLQNLAYNIRKTLFGDQCAAVLQSLILELRIGRKFKSPTTLCEYSFDAWKMSRTVCSVAVVQSLAEAFTELSLAINIAEHKTLYVRKVEVLQYLIDTFKHNESKEIYYLKTLAELHLETHHVEKAVVIYRQLYHLRLKVYGHLHEETHSLFQLLVTYLRQLSLHDEALSLYLEYHEHCEQTLVVTDERRIRSTLTIIEIYEERKEVFKAEQVLVRYWKHVSAAKTTTRITELTIDFALKYSKFLFRHSRKEESEVILRGVYTEIQSYSYEARFESTMIKRVEKIAKYFSKLEVFSMSRSIYQSLYEHYERHEQRTSTECITIVRTLAETITKSITHSKTISSSETTTKKTSTTVISKEEKTLTEIFESCMESTKITATTISVCQALCSSYMFEERYEEACEIYSRVIKKVWASIETTVVVDITEEIIESFTEEVVELVIGLAVCHFKMLRIDIAETIYLNLFRVLICTRYIENKHFILAKIKLVLEFFKTIYKYERVIEIYRELFVWMPICFGKTHSETILVLIEFARICFRMSLYEEAATACFYVYSCFHIAHRCLHFDGFEAAYLLCQIYEIQCKWELAYEVYGFLWRTFVRFGAEYELNITMIEKIYHRYMFVLEHHHHAEYTVLLQISREFYESCQKFYGHHHDITIKATLFYAHQCEMHTEHRETAISLYESVIKYCKETKTEFSKKTLYTCNTRVAKMYASSTKEITKAVSIYKEQYEMCRTTKRTSTETISALHSLVTTYKKQETKESISTATSTLKSSVLDIFQHESHSENLIESARSIAKIYHECQFHEQAETLISEMRTKVVEDIRASVTSSTKVEQKSYIFLASFQETLSESSFTSVMSELREEVLMYESYFKATKKSTDYRSMIKSGCSLYFHLEKKTSRHTEFVKLEKELTEYFCKYLNFSRTVKEGIMHFFFQLYLRQINKTHYEHEVVRSATETVLKFTKTAKFGEAYDLVLLIDKFIHLHGGFHSEFYIRTGFNLARYLVGVGTNKCSDEKLYSSMLDLSRVILQEALGGLDKIDIELSELQQLLADLVTMLSGQKKYQDLERILQTLWKTKTIRNNMSSSPLVLFIGRSLIQTLACLGKLSEAIHLCYHIRYNLEYIRGALDKSTLEFTLLLSELYTAQHRYREAFDLSEDILSRLGEGQTAPGLDPLRIAAAHTELLKFAYKRNGKFDKSPQHYYDIFAALDEQFEDEKGWKEKRPQLEKWAPGVKDGESFGCWKAPTKFEWRVEEEESVPERKWREELVKRRASGNLWAKASAQA